MDKVLEKVYDWGCRVIEKMKAAFGVLPDDDKVVVCGVIGGSIVAFFLGGAIIQAGILYGGVMLATIAILLGYSNKARLWLSQHVGAVDVTFTVLLLVVGLWGGVIKAVGLMFMGFYISAYLRVLRGLTPSPREEVQDVQAAC